MGLDTINPKLGMKGDWERRQAESALRNIREREREKEEEVERWRRRDLFRYFKKLAQLDRLVTNRLAIEKRLGR
jgi:hypothetical protein